MGEVDDHAFLAADRSAADPEQQVAHVDAVALRVGLGVAEKAGVEADDRHLESAHAWSSAEKVAETEPRGPSSADTTDPGGVATMGPSAPDRTT